MTDVVFLSALEQATLIRRRELSPVELVETYLERIERLDAGLRAYVTVSAEEALADARRAEDELARGDGLPPFHGVPIPIKDLTLTAGIRTTYSCRAFAEFVPAVDAAVVRRFRDAGFVVLGKTNTPEFGTIPVTESDLNGACLNPWDTQRTPGGSSGGAAAAVAAGLAPIAHGTDGGGSIRIPASCCGLYGLKPSRGRISAAPLTSFEGLGTSGLLSRTVADTAAALDALVGYEPGDPYWLPEPERPFADAVTEPPHRLRIALTTRPPEQTPLDDVCAAAARDAAHVLAGLGHDVAEVDPPWTDDSLLETFRTVWQTLPTIYAVTDRSLLTETNRRLVESAFASPSPAFVGASQRLQLLARRVVAFWNDVDVVLTPTLARPPVELGWIGRGGEDPFVRGLRFTPFTPLVNVTGQPAASVPFAWHHGLPIGIQLIGPPAGDALVLRLSAQLEEARPWRDRHPPGTA